MIKVNANEHLASSGLQQQRGQRILDKPACQKRVIKKAAQRLAAPSPVPRHPKSNPIHPVSKTLRTFSGDGGAHSPQADQ
jgi:hypothetical protein